MTTKDEALQMALDADKAREIVAFMHKAFPEIAPAQSRRHTE